MVWVTKYCLTGGIEYIQIETTHSPDYVQEARPGTVSYPRDFHGQGKDWHISKESAVTKAEDMRVKKIASLRKQITKLEKIKFD